MKNKKKLNFSMQNTYIKRKTMNENLDIFICTHTNLGKHPTNPVYKVVAQKKMDIDTNLPVYYCEPEKMGVWGQMPRGLSELFNMYYVRHFVEKKEYIGFCQYRSFPFFYNNVPDVAKVLEDNDIIVHRFYIKDVDSVHKQYLDNEAYKLYEEIFKTEYPEYGALFDEYVHQYDFAQRNMFIMKTEDFNKMMDFLFDVLQKYIDRIHCYSDDDLMKRALDIIENKKYPENMRQYQLNPRTLSRFLAYYSEFVLSFYIWKNFKRRKTMNIFMMGDRKLDGE